MLPVQASSPILLNSSSQSVPCGPGGKQQVPGSKRSRPDTKKSENISFTLSEPDLCTQLCLSLLSCCALRCPRPLGQSSPQGGPGTTEQPKEPRTGCDNTLRGSPLISLGCRAGNLFTKLGVGRRIKTRSHVVPHFAERGGDGRVAGEQIRHSTALA